jgi:hypothetical protein
MKNEKIGAGGVKRVPAHQEGIPSWSRLEGKTARTIWGEGTTTKRSRNEEHYSQ